MTEATHQVATTGIDRHGRKPGRENRSRRRVDRTGDPHRRVRRSAPGRGCGRGGLAARSHRGARLPRRSGDYRRQLHRRVAAHGRSGVAVAGGRPDIRGRIKELINRGGEKISPERVEGVLAGHPDVLEVAVFGVPDKLYGETVAAVIVTRESASPTSGRACGVLPRAAGRFRGSRQLPPRPSALPHTAKGSLDRRAVAQHSVADHRAADATFPQAARAPESPMR